jgi:hypothetical protein
VREDRDSHAAGIEIEGERPSERVGGVAIQPSPDPFCCPCRPAQEDDEPAAAGRPSRSSGTQILRVNMERESKRDALYAAIFDDD